MKVLGDKILVEVASAEEVTESGIILSNAKAERKYEGIVVGVGSHEDIKKIGVSEGDYVYYTKGMNIEFEQDGKLYDILSIYDIVAKKEA